MPNKFKLRQKEQWFIDMGKKDPLTGEKFKVGDVIVICVICKTPHLYDSWSYNKNQCSNNCFRIDKNRKIKEKERLETKFDESLFRYKGSHKFKIKDNIQVNWRNKLKWFDWNRWMSMLIVGLTFILMVISILYYTSFVELRGTDIYSDIKGIMNNFFNVIKKEYISEKYVDIFDKAYELSMQKNNDIKIIKNELSTTINKIKDTDTLIGVIENKDMLKLKIENIVKNVKEVMELFYRSLVKNGCI